MTANFPTDMKTVISLSFAMLFGTLLHAATPETSPPVSGFGRIKVELLGVRSEKGDLRIALFDSKRGFPGKFERASARGVVAALSRVYVFEQVPYGSYAISVTHDENRNGKLDANFLGIPKEGVGASNNPKARFGPPSFDDARFELDRQEVVRAVRLTYL